jgi:hypothetical protein
MAKISTSFSTMRLAMLWLGLVGVTLLGSSLPAFAPPASSDQVFTQAKNATDAAFCWIRPVILAMLGTALLALAAATLFGRFRWFWLFCFVAAAAVVVLAEKIVTWLTGTPLTNFTNPGCPTYTPL